MRHWREDFEAIGTRWTIDVYTEHSERVWKKIAGEARQRIERFDQDYSRFRPDSLVATMGKKAGTYPLPRDGFALLSFYKRLYDATDGLVTPLIGRMMEDAGYDAAYSFESNPLSPPPAWDEALEFSRMLIEVKQPVLLDVAAAGKGYLVDMVAAILEGHDIRKLVINAGGDILQRDPANRPLRVGLENPLDRSQAIGVAQVANRSLCGSSGALRAWGDYHHILDPVALRSPRDILATWAVADDTMTADGLATALFLVNPDKLSAFSFEYAMLTKDMNIRCSSHFPAELFT